MDELMLMKYLKSKGIENMNEHEFIHKFKEFMHKQGGTSYMRNHEDWDYSDMDDIKYRRMGRPYKRNQLGYYDMYAEYPEYALHSERKHGKPYSGFNMMQDYMMDEHFDEHSAKHIVSEMYHIENGRKHTGEVFSMSKAKEVYDKYENTIPSDVTVCDIYVAINAQYHDYGQLFKSWFGSNIDSKIIESAILFWFKDIDYDKGFKLMEYFKEY